MQITVWKDGSYIVHKKGYGWEYQDDPDWLVLIDVPNPEDAP